MNLWTLARRSLAHYAVANLGVILGAAVGTAALVGALVVGDSMRASLLRKSLEGLGPFDYALFSGDRFFRQELAGEIGQAPGSAVTDKPDVCGVLLLGGIAANSDGSARANRVQIIGVTAEYLAMTGLAAKLEPGTAYVNPALAGQLRLKTGDEVLLRLPKPGALSREVALTDRENSTVALRVTVAGQAPSAKSGNFSLFRSQLEPLNIFVPIDDLARAANMTGKANALLAGSSRANTSRDESLDRLQSALESRLRMEDLALELRKTPAPAAVELRTSRVFLDTAVVAAAVNAHGGSRPVPLLTYLGNLIQKGTNSTPYSFVTAVGAPYTPGEMRDDEILITEWLAQDLSAKPGDKLALSYFDPEAGARLLEKTNEFIIRAVVPNAAPWDDKTLMPDFPGIEKAESTGDWEVGFELVHKVRPKDEAYWKEKRGTPKAFITLAAGQRLWSSRFGQTTAVRWLPNANSSVDESAVRSHLLEHTKARDFGLVFEPVREQAIRAVQQSQDFGQLFIGFSFFVIGAALLLTALLFQFNVEQRTSEFGTLLAVGFAPSKVRRLLLLEGAGLAAIGALLGAALGVVYACAMLFGLGTIWRGATGTSTLELYLTPASLIIGIVSGVVAAVFAVWITVRRQSRTPALDLLSGEQRTSERGSGKVALLTSLLCIAGSIAITLWSLGSRAEPNPGAFFGAGVLLLIGGVAAVSALLARLGRGSRGTTLTMGALALRGNARRRKRAVTTVALLSAGAFLIAAIGVFRLDADHGSNAEASGTGGFQWIGESTLPIVQDLNTREGREFFALSADDMRGVSIISMRVKAGDDASCLNLNRAQKPRLLGVDPGAMKGRFTFNRAAKNLDQNRKWELLRDWKNSGAIPEIPAIGDANSVQWALGKSVGDTVDYQDDRGNAVRLRIVATVANSILQGALIIDEGAFQQLFPGETGYRFFLVQTPSGTDEATAAALTRATRDTGMELTSAVARLEQFNAVQNTYLGAFQVLGGLGLLLGSAGIGMVVLRNVLERKGELALLSAVGFSNAQLRRMLLGEHAILLACGLCIGIAAAALAVLPAVFSSARHVPAVSLGWTLAAVAANGLFWTWLATRWALRGDPLNALRNE